MRDKGEGHKGRELLYIVNFTVTGLLGSVTGGGREGGPWREGHGLLHTDRWEEPQGGVCRADSLPSGRVPILPPPQWHQQLVCPFSILFLIPLFICLSFSLSHSSLFLTPLSAFSLSLCLSLSLSLSLSTYKNGKKKFHNNKHTRIKWCLYY